MQQVTMRTMDFEHVEAGGVGARGGSAPVLNHFRYFVGRKRARFRIAGIRDGARADQLPFSPVIDTCRLFVQRPAPFPRGKASVFAPAVTGLDAWHGRCLSPSVWSLVPSDAK